MLLLMVLSFFIASPFYRGQKGKILHFTANLLLAEIPGYHALSLHFQLSVAFNPYAGSG